MKPGFKTTEFAFTVLFLVLGVLMQLSGQINDPMLSQIANAVVVAAYAIARGLAKKNHVDPEKLPKLPQ